MAEYLPPGKYPRSILYIHWEIKILMHTDDADYSATVILDEKNLQVTMQFTGFSDVEEAKSFAFLLMETYKIDRIGIPPTEKDTIH
tara:strand:+ start:1022 stop:1279 length:258 start_codon:yes stop_codon:yes gene_type:complete